MKEDQSKAEPMNLIISLSFRTAKREYLSGVAHGK